MTRAQKITKLVMEMYGQGLHDSLYDWCRCAANPDGSMVDSLKQNDCARVLHRMASDSKLDYYLN